MMKMMSLQLKIWKRLITNQPPLSSHHQLISPRPPPLSFPFISKPHITFPNFCSQAATPSTTPPESATPFTTTPSTTPPESATPSTTPPESATPSTTTPSTTPPESGVVIEFFLDKCGLSEKDIANAFRHCDIFLRAKSTQNLEEVLELLNGFGLTTSEQIRKVVFCNPKFFFYKAQKNLQPKLTLLKTFMKEDDISKLLITNTRVFDAREDNLKSVISFLQGSGLEGQALSELVATEPSLLMLSKEKVMESFKQAEDLGFKKGTKAFAYALPAIGTVGKRNLKRTLQYLSSLGFSEEQISDLCSRYPRFLVLSEENLKSTVDFMVNHVELPLADLVKCPLLLTYSLEKRIIPRYRVMEALTSFQEQEKIPFLRIFLMTEKQFLKKYVNRNTKSSILRTIYYGGKAGRFITDK